MRGLDTNILVRFLAADDRKQLGAVQSLFEECRLKDEPLYLPVLMVCELVWVLDRRYSQSRAQICEALDRILQIELFRFEHETLVRRSLEMFRTGRAQFSDYLLGEICRQAGCRDTVTFDRDLRGAPGYMVL
jgi:predicted nucleic-acid-binding protein